MKTTLLTISLISASILLSIIYLDPAQISDFLDKIIYQWPTNHTYPTHDRWC